MVNGKRLIFFCRKSKVDSRLSHVDPLAHFTKQSRLDAPLDNSSRISLFQISYTLNLVSDDQVSSTSQVLDYPRLELNTPMCKNDSGCLFH